MAGPLAIPLVAGAIGAARALGPRMAPYWSRYGAPALQGLQRYGSQIFTKQNLVNALKQAPMVFAEDVAFDQAGKAINPLVERYGDARGLYKSLHNANPIVAGIDGGLTALDIDYERIPTKISSLFTNVAKAAEQIPEEINLSTQHIPSPKRTDIRLNENFATPQLPSRELNNDFTNLYNTPLTSIEQQGFKAWLKTLPENQRSMRDYDLQGYYKFARDGVDPKNFYLNHDNPDTHFNDYFKKPNHPTFSVYSKYNGQDGWQGSRWYPLDKDESKWMLDVNPTNTRSPRGLARYMQEAESSTVFSDPRGQYSTVKYSLVTPNQNIIF